MTTEKIVNFTGHPPAAIHLTTSNTALHVYTVQVTISTLLDHKQQV